jgi:hypothetical protein
MDKFELETSTEGEFGMSGIDGCEDKLCIFIAAACSGNISLKILGATILSALTLASFFDSYLLCPFAVLINMPWKYNLHMF